MSEMKYPEFVKLDKITVNNFGYDNKHFRFILNVPFDTNGGRFLTVIMKNPSVANEQHCDRTMSKVCNAAYLAGFDGVSIMNLFPYRAQYAVDLYKQFCSINDDLYNRAMSDNQKLIAKECAGADVVFAWGTNTINTSKSFCEVYDGVADSVVRTVAELSTNIITLGYDKTGKYPIHALRWSHDILLKNIKVRADVKKHTVIHHNMFGPSCEIEGLDNKKDFEIYCYKEHKVCVPNCDGCPYFSGSEMGKGIACAWEESYEAMSSDEHVVQNDETYFEFQRVENPDFYKEIMKMIEDGELDLCKVIQGLD